MYTRGLGQTTFKNYLTVSGGKFRRKATPDSDPSIVKSRIKANGEQVDEEVYAQLTGTLKELSFDLDNQNGPQLDVVVESDEEFSFSLGLFGGAAKSLLKALPNANLAEDITFIPKYSEEMKDGKMQKSSTIFLNQNGNSLKWHFKKEQMNGMPQAKVVIDELTKKETYDSKNQVAFLMDYTKKHIIPKLGGLPIGESSPSKVKSKTIEISTEDSDLPF